MHIKQYVVDGVITFAIVLVVNLIVTYLYGLVFHGTGAVDWETAFRFAITFGIVLPWIRQRGKEQGEK